GNFAQASPQASHALAQPSHIGPTRAPLREMSLAAIEQMSPQSTHVLSVVTWSFLPEATMAVQWTKHFWHSLEQSRQAARHFSISGLRWTWPACGSSARAATTSPRASAAVSPTWMRRMTDLLGATADAPGDEPFAAQADPRSSRMRLSYATDVPAESLPGRG